nr:MAG TPA: hypothetical protein [Caudoviricetes sp.]
MERSCAFELIVVYACAQRGGFRIVGEGCGCQRLFKGPRRRSERVLGWG